MQNTPGIFNLGEQQLTEECSAKNAHYFQKVDKIEDSSRRKYMVHTEIVDVISKKIRLQSF